MPRYDNILFPTDLATGSEDIALHVTEMADAFESNLHILHVVHTQHYHTEMDMITLYSGDCECDAIPEAKEKLREFGRKYLYDRPSRISVVSGFPGDQILRYAESGNVDLIIMGHCRKGIERLTLGSVSGYVVKRSRAPVMIVNHH